VCRLVMAMAMVLVKDNVMARDENDWNWDRIHSAQALIADVQNDMMNCLHRQQVADIVRDRMISRLTEAREQISRLSLYHD